MADAYSRRTWGSRWLGLMSRGRPATVVAACLLGVSGCASGTASVTSREPSVSPQATSSASATPSALPHFSDWRMAYLAPDGRAHIVTLDGKSDLTGSLLPGMTSNGLSVSNAGVGSDGKTVAYVTTGLNLVDLTGQTPPRSPQVYGGFNNILWSPKQDKLYSDIGGGRFFYLTLATGQATNVNPGDGIAGAVGWIDDTHLAALSYQGAHLVDGGNGNKFPTSVKLVSLDLRTNQARTIVDIQGGGPAWFDFIMSPDGSQALYYDTPNEQAVNNNQPFTPQVALITLATGHVTWLPVIARATGGVIFNVAWRPGSETVAVSLNRAAGQGGANTWLLDVAADTATPLSAPGMVMAWTPDNGPLVVSSGYQSEVGGGPYTLWAMSCGNGARQCSATTLTTQAMTFDFLGFARNP
jgi:hypothetical protein